MRNIRFLAYPDYASIVNLYTITIHAMYGKTPGQIRGAKGDPVENIVDTIVKLA